MFERIILMIDDDPKVNETLVDNYRLRIDQIKSSTQWDQYDFKLLYRPSLLEAKKFLENNNLIDVLVVDYNFNGETDKGTKFISYVRENINRQCKIIFYTMQGISTIENVELMGLINSDVYRMIDKSIGNDIMAQAIFDAATSCNPVVISLERFFHQYKDILKKVKYTIDGAEYTLDNIINHIRMDDDVGRIFIDKLLYQAILKETEISD